MTMSSDQALSRLASSEREGAADGGGEVGGVSDVLVKNRGVAEFGDEGGGFLAGEFGKGVGGGEVVGGGLAGDGAQNGDGELPGAGGGGDDGGAAGGGQLAGDLPTDGGVGVEEVVEAFPGIGDGGLGLGGVGPAGGEGGLEVVEGIAFDLVAPLGLELGHPGAELDIVALVEEPEEALDVGGEQDVHGGGVGDGEVAAGVVAAGADEVADHTVLVGGDSKAADGGAEEAGVPRREDVAEVASGNDNVEGAGELARGVKVVGDLREEAADVDGVGRGEASAGGLGGGVEGGVGEGGLDRRLRIVEVTADGAGGDVAAGAADHLAALDLGDAGGGIEGNERCTGNARETVHSRAAGVAAGGGEDADALQAFGARGGGQQVRQQGEGDILKGQGGAVEELQEGDVTAVAQGHGVGGVVKAGEGVGNGAGAGLFGEFGEEASEKSLHGVGEGVGGRERGKGLGGDVEAAIGGEAGQEGVGGINGGRAATGGDVVHGVPFRHVG